MNKIRCPKDSILAAHSRFILDQFVELKIAQIRNEQAFAFFFFPPLRQCYVVYAIVKKV